jgi:hypothetical protein
VGWRVRRYCRRDLLAGCEVGGEDCAGIRVALAVLRTARPALQRVRVQSSEFGEQAAAPGDAQSGLQELPTGRTTKHPGLTDRNGRLESPFAGDLDGRISMEADRTSVR